MVTAYIALGANLGDAAASLGQAARVIDQLPLTQLSRKSSLYRSAPLDTDGTKARAAPGKDYVNAVVAVETTICAPELLDRLLEIEQLAGRKRPYRNAPRTLDLDLLLYGSATVQSPCLTVPHARMFQRAFVLVPLAEISSGLVTALDLNAVKDQCIERIDGAW